MLKKRDLEAAVDNFSLEERDTMLQKWYKIDAEEAIASLKGELGAEVTESTGGDKAAL